MFRACNTPAARLDITGRRAGTLGHVADDTVDATSASEAYPGQHLGLPAEGRGSLASWRARVGALIIDWAACMAIAVGFFGTAVLTGGGWRAWMILTVFFVESTVLSWLAGGSFGQVLSRIAVVRLDMKPLGLPRALLRAFLVSLALPALIISVDRRGLQDLAAGTVVINRR
jgi:RDD family